MRCELAYRVVFIVWTKWVYMGARSRVSMGRTELGGGAYGHPMFIEHAQVNPTFPKTSIGFMRDQKDESPWCAFTCWHEYTSNPLDIHLHTLP